MIGWLAWVGTALVLISLVLDDRRSFRVVNLAAAVAMLAISSSVGPATLVAVDVAVVALGVHHLLRPAPERPMVRIVTESGARSTSLVNAA